MKNNFVRKAISTDLNDELERVQVQIKTTFKLDLSKIQCSKIIAWKAKTYKPIIDSNQLIKILGAKV